MTVFCTVKIFFKQHDATLIYTGIKLCKVFFGTPGIFDYTTKTVQRGMVCNHKWNSFRLLRFFTTFFQKYNFLHLFINNIFRIAFSKPPSGPILEKKGMRVIFQKKGKRGPNIWKFGQKCTKFENILKRGSFICATFACMKQLEYALTMISF